MRDAGKDAGDVPVFIGPGSITVTWTVNGMPAATGCAAAGAAFVGVQTSFGNPVRVPCEQGTYSEESVLAGQLSVGTTLLRADGTAIYCYSIAATVVSDRTTTSSINFEPPGTLRVRWTVNGNPGSSECPLTAAAGVQVTVRGQAASTASCTAGGITIAGRTTANAVCRPSSQGLQPGRYPVSAVIFTAQGDRIQAMSAEAEVPSGGVGDVVVPFEVPLLPVDP